MFDESKVVLVDIAKLKNDELFIIYEDNHIIMKSSKLIDLQKKIRKHNLYSRDYKENFKSYITKLPEEFALESNVKGLDIWLINEGYWVRKTRCTM